MKNSVIELRLCKQSNRRKSLDCKINLVQLNSDRKSLIVSLTLLVLNLFVLKSIARSFSSNGKLSRLSWLRLSLYSSAVKELNKIKSFRWWQKVISKH